MPRFIRETALMDLDQCTGKLRRLEPCEFVSGHCSPRGTRDAGLHESFDGAIPTVHKIRTAVDEHHIRRLGPVRCDARAALSSQLDCSEERESQRAGTWGTTLETSTNSIPGCPFRASTIVFILSQIDRISGGAASGMRASRQVKM